MGRNHNFETVAASEWHPEAPVYQLDISRVTCTREHPRRDQMYWIGQSATILLEALAYADVGLCVEQAMVYVLYIGTWPFGQV